MLQLQALICGKRCANFLIGHDRGDFVLHVFHRNIMMLWVVGIDTVCRHNDFPVALVRINRRHTDAGVRVDPGENQHVGPQSAKHLVELGTEKSAVSLLDHDRV